MPQHTCQLSRVQIQTFSPWLPMAAMTWSAGGDIMEEKGGGRGGGGGGGGVTFSGLQSTPAKPATPPTMWTAPDPTVS